MKMLLRATVSHLLIGFLMCSSGTLWAQSSPACGTETPAGSLARMDQLRKQFSTFQTTAARSSSSNGSCITSYPLNVFMIRRSNGTGGLSTSDIQAAFAIVNQRFASACVEFYICSTTVVNSDAWYDLDNSERNALFAAHYVSGGLNVYFANSLSGTNSSGGTSYYCGYAYYPDGSFSNDIVAMDYGCTTNGSTLSHEMGHSFGLPHTHNGAGGSNAELVNGSNCATAGDRFCDTPADPTLGSSTVNSSCVYTGTLTDANGMTYSPNPQALMSYSRKACRDYFSPQQYAWMQMEAETSADRRSLACASFSVDFTAAGPTTCTSTAASTFTSTSTGATTYAWDFDNDGTVDSPSSTASYTYSSPGLKDVSLSISNGTTTIRRLKRNAVEIGAGSQSPYLCGFEASANTTTATGYELNWSATPQGGYRQFQWNVTSGGTPSSNTGPQGGYSPTGFGGQYAFLEASEPNGGNWPAGQVAQLESGCIQLPAASAELRFFYHMYGAQMGSLHLDIQAGGLWVNDVMPALVGQQHANDSSPFLERVVDLSAFAGQIIRLRFRGVGSGGFTSDMAIDQITLDVSSAPLPAELVRFTGEPMPAGNQLTWSTASEENVASFVVEASTDALVFHQVAEVKSRGIAVARADYEVVDPDASATGLTYYRLHTVDEDGSRETSKMIAVRRMGEDVENTAQNTVRLSPNPGFGMVWVSLPASADQLTVQDARGRIVRSYLPNNSTLQLDLKDLPAGLYVVSAFSAGQAFESARLVLK